MTLSRRTYLAALGATTAVTGCNGRPRSTDGRSRTETNGAAASGTASGVRVETVASNLEVPWGAAFRDGDLYLTERPGRVVRVPGAVTAHDGRTELVTDVFPDLQPQGEGGLLGLVFHPAEPLAFTYGTYQDGNRIVRHDLSDGWRAETVLSGIPAASIHDGGRLAVRGDELFATTGDAARSERAQDRDSLAGKVLRLTLDGDPHPDNPFRTAVFSYGHRNPQGLAFRGGGERGQSAGETASGTRRIFSTEHGPDVDDEINVLRAGANYGWPTVTGRSDRDEFVDPIATYASTIAPASAAFYPDDGPVRAWQGDFFFGTLVGEHLRRVRIRGETVSEQERLYSGRFGRLRTAFVGPDGHLYATTSNRDGRGSPRAEDDRVLRFTPYQNDK